jgi:hypothetical protein
MSKVSGDPKPEQTTHKYEWSIVWAPKFSWSFQFSFQILARITLPPILVFALIREVGRRFFHDTLWMRLYENWLQHPTATLIRTAADWDQGWLNFSADVLVALAASAILWIVLALKK